MRKTKICFVTNFFHPVIGGVETYILQTSKELMKRGYEAEVITSDSDRGKEIAEKREVYQGIVIKRVHSPFLISFGEPFMPGILKEILKSDADIFHFHGYRHIYNLAVFLTKKPCFITTYWPEYRGQRPWVIQLIAETVDAVMGKRMLNKHRGIYILTEPEKNWLASLGADRGKIMLTPYALPANYFKKYDGKKFRKKYGLGEKIVVLSVSRIHRSKGIDQLVSAAEWFPDIKFVIMGKNGGAEAALRAQASRLKLKNVIFAGETTEKEKLEAYEGSDIFCSCSHFEAFGISVLEAMSQGCAVITSNRGGLPWVAGKTGLVFKDGNMNDLIKKLSRVIANKSLRETMQKKARERASEFSWKKTVDALDQAYKKALT